MPSSITFGVELLVKKCKPYRNRTYANSVNIGHLDAKKRYFPYFIVDPVTTYTLVSLCELVNVCLTEPQETNSLCYNGGTGNQQPMLQRRHRLTAYATMEAQANSLCYKCKHIFGFYYKPPIGETPQQKHPLIRGTLRGNA